MRFLFLFFFVIFFSCQNKHQTKSSNENEFFFQASNFSEQNQSESEKENRAISQFLKTQTLAALARELFMVNINGNDTFKPVEQFNGNDLVAGSYIFFSYNLQDDAKAIIDFTSDVKNFCARKNLLPAFLALDEEGGEVSRLRKVIPNLPSPQKISKELLLTDAFELYSIVAKEISALGFSLNLAPVVESETTENFLGERSFGNEKKVADFAKMFLLSMQNENVASCLKHFPGNGKIDPHENLPIIQGTEYELHTLLFPFQNLLLYKPETILLSHLIVKNVDETPACLSRVWIKNFLQETLSFDGLVISDDIYMKALSDAGFPPERATLAAIEAGCDVIMISEKRFGNALSFLLSKANEDENFQKRIRESAEKIIRFKIKHGIVQLKKTNKTWELVFPLINADEKNAQLEKFNLAKEEHENFLEKHKL